MLPFEHPTLQIADEFRRVPPIKRVRLEYLPWRGLMSLDPAAEILRALLPLRFEDLQRDFAVGACCVLCIALHCTLRNVQQPHCQRVA